MAAFVAPNPSGAPFTCPHCDTVAQQVQVWGLNHSNNTGQIVMRCQNCSKGSIFEEGRLVYPAKSSAPRPNEDLSTAVRAIYDEAADISSRSARGAAALLRLALQMLLAEQGKEGRIDESIQELIDERQLNPSTTDAMDVLRITGNESVHPGEINLADDQELALSLFEFLNHIAQELVSVPKRVAAMKARMPANKLQGIAERQARSDRTNGGKA